MCNIAPVKNNPYITLVTIIVVFEENLFVYIQGANVKIYMINIVFDVASINNPISIANTNPINNCPIMPVNCVIANNGANGIFLHHTVSKKLFISDVCSSVVIINPFSYL